MSREERITHDQHRTCTRFDHHAKKALKIIRTSRLKELEGNVSSFRSGLNLLDDNDVSRIICARKDRNQPQTGNGLGQQFETLFERFRTYSEGPPGDVT